MLEELKDKISYSAIKLILIDYNVLFNSPTYSEHADKLINFLAKIVNRREYYIEAGKMLLKLTLDYNQQYSYITKKVLLEFFAIASSTKAPLKEKLLLLDTLQYSDEL